MASIASNDALILSHRANPLRWDFRERQVQARLGHASIQMTADRYGHLFPRGDDGAELAAAERAFLRG
jgi:integrase